MSAYVCQTLTKEHLPKIARFTATDAEIAEWFRQRASLYVTEQDHASLFTVVESHDAIDGFMWSIHFEAVALADGADIGPVWAVLYWSFSGIAGPGAASRAVELVYHTVNEASVLRPGMAFLWHAGERAPEDILRRSEFEHVSGGLWRRRMPAARAGTAAAG